MSAGRDQEGKPSWSDVPEGLRNKVQTLIGAPIAAAEIVRGGFGPSATFVLRTSDDRRFFCKGAHPGQTEEGRAALLLERANYENFPELAAFAPRYRGSADEGDWRLLVLENIERTKDVPPWDEESFEEAVELLARFHAETPDRASSVLTRAEDASGFNLFRPEFGWDSLSRDSNARDRFLSLFDEDAACWFDTNLERLVGLENSARSLNDGPCSWIHLDVRSDNLIFGDDDVRLVDWSFLAIGPTLIDVAFFLPSIAGEGGPSPAEGLRAYEQTARLRFEREHIAIAAATVSGFFAARAGEPDLPLLPRLRWVQRLQLFPALDWTCDVLGIDRPTGELR